MAGHIATSNRQDWCTPAEVLAPVRGVFGGQIRIDPCWNENAITDPVLACSGGIADDGLETPWMESTFFNPPFGVTRRHIERATFCSREEWKALDRKARAEYRVTTPLEWCLRAKEQHDRWGADVIGLIPAAVDTEVWQRSVFGVADAVCFWRGRMTFLGATAPAPMACALVYWGAKPWRFHQHFEAHGRVVRP